MLWFRRAALRVTLRLAARGVWSDLEHVLMMDPCPGCGTWRCPDCRWLIRTVHDHNWSCVRRRLPHAGGA